jgi:asparagine synthase (glutamine-hydrolysing)
MCGLAGWATTSIAPDASALAPMAVALAHRNDAETLCAVVDRQVRRAVALVASHSDAESGISIALDGAILNAAALRAQLAKRGYAFKTQGDAELLLRAYQQWDKDVVKQLRGAFAFAVWDARKQRLMLARDRFGQKPLYLHQAGAMLAFASEVKALVRTPGVKSDVDVEAVGDYLALGYVRGPRTLIAGVRKLAPGSYALWQFGALRETRYWSPPDGLSFQMTPLRGGPAKPIEGFIERLDEAVRLHMDAARPAGVLLTGGYDSAAIVALMRQHGERVASFSAGFADDKRSELAAAALVAKHFGTEHHEIVLERRDVLARLPQLVASRDAPVSRPADAALHLLAREAARTVKVALSGDGGDEILGGYGRHTFLRGFAPESMTKARRVNGLCVIPVADPKAPSDGLRSILYYEQTGWLADNLLERSDRMTATASLELRTPFLDHRVAEYVSALPDAARVRGLSTKWILRQADRRLIGDAAFKPRKAGFRIALADLMRGESRELLADQLRGPGCLTRGYYDGKVLDRLLDEHFAARRNHEQTLWTLLNLEIWHRTYRRS